MNLYLKKNNTLRKRVLTYSMFMIVAIVMLNVFFPFFKNAFYGISSPITTYFLAAGQESSSFFYHLFDIDNTREEKNDLRQENERLRADIVMLRDYLKQQEEFKEAKENTMNDYFEMVPVEIVGMDVENDFIIINKGSEDGVGEQMPVISSQKVLFGKVVNVYKNFSKVMLVSHKDSVVSVRVENLFNDSYFNQKEGWGDLNNEEQIGMSNDDIVYGAVRGQGGLSLYLDLVSIESEIKEGGMLVTSALEGIFPKNLLVGSIASVHRNDVKPFQTAAVNPFFNILKVRGLMVITNHLK